MKKLYIRFETDGEFVQSVCATGKQTVKVTDVVGGLQYRKPVTEFSISLEYRDIEEEEE